MKSKKLLHFLKHLCALGAILVALLLMMFFIKTSFVDDASKKSRGYYINDTYDMPSREFIHGQTVEQEFSASGNFYGMTVRFHNAAQPQAGTLHFELVRKPDMAVVAQGTANTETLVNDGYSALIFDQPYRNTSGSAEDYILRLTPEFVNGNAFMRIWEKIEINSIGFGVINRRPGEAAINRYFYTLCLITLAGTALIYFICFVVKMRKETIFVIAYLCVSLMITLVLPPYSSPDEEAHYNSAYKLVNKMEGYTNMQLITSTLYTREEDHNGLFEDQYTTVFTYEYINDNLFAKSKDNSVVSKSHNWLVKDFNGVYTMGALGILTGKILNLGYVATMYMGRLFNVLFFTLCLYFAIKITPVGKETFMVLSFLPITMHLSNSFSRDTFVIAMGFLFTAYLLNLLHQKERYKVWQLALLVLICVLLAPSKFIYSCMCALVVLLIKDNLDFKTNKAKLIKILAGIVVLGIVLLAIMYKIYAPTFLYVLDSFKVSTPLEELMLNSPQSTFNIGLILSYPMVFLKLVLNTIYANGAYYIKSIAGGVLSYNSVRISDAFIFILLALVIISICTTPSDEYELRTRDRLSFLAVFGLVAALVVYVAVTWTPVIDSTIYGIQGKYLMPAIPLALIACKNKTFVAKKEIFNGLCFSVALTTILVAWNAFTVIMQR